MKKASIFSIFIVCMLITTLAACSNKAAELSLTHAPAQMEEAINKQEPLKLEEMPVEQELPQMEEVVVQQEPPLVAEVAAEQELLQVKEAAAKQEPPLVNEAAAKQEPPLVNELSLEQDPPLVAEFLLQPKSTGRIYLYGETHGVEKIMEKELELWQAYYHNEGMRHLFYEIPYFSAAFLNVWMKEDNDDLLDALYQDWEGTSLHTPDALAFFQGIKRECPETIFHGFDVGHQYNTTGLRYKKYLEEHNMTDTTQYALLQEVAQQGYHYYQNNAHTYRENKMAENFIRTFDGLTDQNIMGICGGAHLGIHAMDYYTKSVPSMANQLQSRYAEALFTEDLSWLARDIEPYRVDALQVGEKTYEASYFGQEDITWHNDFTARAFWRLENAYDDFADNEKTGDLLPYNNYPMLIETGQVFAICYTKTDGSILWLYYRSNGLVWNDQPATVGFAVE